MVTLVKLAAPDGKVYHELRVEGEGFSFTKLFAEPEGKVGRETLSEVKTEMTVETKG